MSGELCHVMTLKAPNKEIWFSNLLEGNPAQAWFRRLGAGDHGRGVEMMQHLTAAATLTGPVICRPFGICIFFGTAYGCGLMFLNFVVLMPL